MADPGGRATCVKADTLGLPSDHMLNCAVFDVVMEIIYLLIKTKHFGPYGIIYVHQHTYSMTPEPIIIWTTAVSDKSCIYGKLISEP